MHSNIEDFGTGFYGIEISMSRTEADKIITAFLKLKEDASYHFHLRGDYVGSHGIADIMFTIKGNETDNMVVEL